MEKKDIEHLAQLARIELSEEEKELLLKDTERILDFVNQVSALDLPRAESSAEARVGAVYNVMRSDGAAEGEPRQGREPHERGMYTDELLAAAPDTERGYVKVDKIL